MERNFDNPDLKSAQEVAEKIFKIKNLKPYQILVIVNILESSRITGFSERKQQLVILPTGAGKSLCFQIPSVLLSGLTIIVYPLIALMNDQEKVFRQHNISVVTLKGGQTHQEREKIWESLKNNEVHIIITNPETLIQNKTFTNLLKFKIELLVIDEAHVITEWGKSFRPSYLNMCKLLPFLKANQILAFTATADSNMEIELGKYLFSGHRPHIIRADADRDNIFYQGLPTLSKEQDLLMILKYCEKPALVFCRTRIDTELQFWSLKSTRWNTEARYYHAGLDSESRTHIETWFFNSSDGILFATKAYGMGIDKKNIRTVIHFSSPDTVQDFLQESGRAGRDGKQSVSWILIDVTKSTTPVEKIFLIPQCRRKSLLNALGQEEVYCSGCDYCSKTTIEKPDGLERINKLASNPFFWTSSSLSAFLTGHCLTFKCPPSYMGRRFFGSLSYWNMDFLEDAINKLSDNHSLFVLTKNKLLYYNPKLMTALKKLRKKPKTY